MKYYILATSPDPRTYNPCLKKGIHSKHRTDPEILKSIIQDLKSSLQRFL